MILLAIAVLYTLSLISYHPDDIRMLKMPPNRPPVNFIGPLGAYAAYGGMVLLGLAAFLLPLALATAGVLGMRRRTRRFRVKLVYLLGILVAVSCLVELNAEAWAEHARRLNLAPAGGIAGDHLGQRLIARFTGEVGALIITFTLLSVFLVLLFETHPLHLLRQIGHGFAQLYRGINAWVLKHMDEKRALVQEEKEVERKRKRLEKALRREEKEEQQAARAKEAKEPKLKPVRTPVTAVPPREPAAPAAPRKPPAPDPGEVMQVAEVAPGGSVYPLPSIDLLDPIPAMARKKIKGNSQWTAKVLEETLREFNIEVEVTGIERGPVVTRYELLPPPGLKVEKIAALANNLALSLKAESVRVQAPIPGKGVVGVEVPNEQSQVVFLREIVESEAWKKDDVALPLALGKDVSGNVLVGDLGDMPHLLIAGATGSGKTVCMNTILGGLLMSRRPDEMRLMLIDPKIVEFAGYNHLPHLVVPVITEPKKVGLGFRWAINEMEKRYKTFAKVGVRNIRGFNSRPVAKQIELFGDQEGGEEESKIPDRFPYIVIVVDELADLMLVCQAEIENSIARLAQLSRATGIHMILATQRPSVNVITGTIKANFPARVAFQTAQKTDSRTILDAIGAEKLLGKGDMLYMPPGSSRLIRSQGAFTKDIELQRIVDYWRQQGVPQYEQAIQEKMEKNEVELPDMGEDDEMLEPAMEVIRQTRRASTSSLQRRLRIGYTRAARLMDLLEEKGVVGPPRGSDPREILIDLDGDIPQNAEVELEEELDE